LSRLRESWFLKSLLAGAAGCAVDYAVMLTLVKVVGLPAMFGAPAGVISGAIVNFFVNRRVVYGLRGPEGTAGHAVRYAAVILTLLLAHACAMAYAHSELALPLVPTKMATDFLIFGLGQPLALRRLVFPERTGMKLAPEVLS
jgi:putative flippase GtrA